MDKRLIFTFLKSLRFWRFLLPKNIRKFLPRRLITAVILILFLLFTLAKIDWSDLYTQVYSQIVGMAELPKENSSARFYSNQTRSDLKQTYLNAIYSAKSSILIIIYSLRDFSIIQALQEQARRGIDVTVICDAEASSGVSNQLGSSVKVYYQNENGKGIMHLKLMVIDLIDVFVGSANLTGDSFKRHGNLVVGLNSSLVAKAIQQQALSMINPSQKPPSYVAVQFPGQQFELWFLPTSGKTAFHRLMNLLYQAKSSIHIAMYTLTHPRLTDAIIDAHERGIDVQIVLDKSQALEPGADAYKKLLEAGVNVGLSNSNGLLHHKMAWIDERILVNGSANWTLSAFNRNTDCFLVIDPLNNQQQQEMTRLWKIIAQEATYQNTLPREPILLPQ